MRAMIPTVIVGWQHSSHFTANILSSVAEDSAISDDCDAIAMVNAV
jgi:hypothetical protein